MSERLVQRFMDGLHHLEQTGDLEPLVATFGEESETSNVASDRVFRGRDGARDFWRRYRVTFGEMRSSFRNVIVAGDRAALEWVTEGTGPEGDPFRYDGVSLLEMAGGGRRRGSPASAPSSTRPTSGGRSHPTTRRGRRRGNPSSRRRSTTSLST